jgi:recombination protein RecA
VPRGRIVEIFGPESSGKTTLIYHIIAEAQSRGGICAFIDTEHAIDPSYAAQDRGRHRRAARLPARLRRAGAADRRSALSPRRDRRRRDRLGCGADAESRARRPDRRHDRRSAGPSDVAGDAQTRRATSTAPTPVCLFTNQIREKVGVQFGSPETQPGGRALKFYASQRLDIRRIETLKEGTEAVGNRVRVKVVKNKVASPFRQAEFDIEYGVGISREGGLLDFGIEHDLVQKSGSFFSYGKTRLGQGRNNAKQFLVENPELAAELEAKIRAALGIGAAETAPVVEEPPPVAEAQAA